MIPKPKITDAKTVSSYAYRIAINRKRYMKNILDEHILLIAMLFGHLIEEGKKTARDYRRMTVQNINTDLQIRTLLLQSYRLNSAANKKAKQINEEKEAIEELRLFQSG